MSAAEPTYKIGFELRRGAARTGVRIQKLKNGITRYLGAIQEGSSASDDPAPRRSAFAQHNRYAHL